MRIARLAVEAGVSPGLVHYHFDSRDALLAEAIEHSYERAGDARVAPGGDDGDTPAAQRLQAMICLLYTSPSPRDGLLSRMPSSA